MDRVRRSPKSEPSRRPGSGRGTGGAPAGQGAPDIGGLIAGVWRRRRLVVILWILFTGVSTLVALTLREARYKARARLLVDREIRGLAMNSQSPTLQAINVETLMAMVKMEQNLENVRKDLKLEMSREQLAASIHVFNPRNTKIVEVEMIHTLPSKASEIANALSQVVADEAIDQMKHQARETYRSADKELKRINQEIAQVERTLVARAEKDSVSDPKGEIAALIGARRRLMDQMYDARVKRAQAEAREEILEKKIRKTPRRVVDVVRDVKTLQRKLLARQIELDEARSRYTEEHPDVKRLKEGVDKLKGLLSRGAGSDTREVNSRLNPVRSQMEIDYSRQAVLVAASKARLKRLEREVRGITDRLVKIPSISARHQELVRRREALTNFQQKLLRRREEARLVQDSSIRPVRQVTQAVMPDAGKPLSSKSKLVALAGSFLGGIFALGLAVLLALRDGRLRGDKDAIAALDTRVFGKIPRIDEPRDRLLDPQHIGGPLTEVFRNMAAELELREFPLALQLAGVEPEEGASTAATNLAVSLARKGRRVALLDLNLRGERPHPAMALREEVVFGGGAAEKDPVATTENENKDHPDHKFEANTKVDLGPTVVSHLQTVDGPRPGPVRLVAGVSYFPGGGPVASSTEFLSTQRLQELIEELKGEFDVVLLDGPSMTPFADGRSLARNADEVLLVMSSWKTHKESAVRAREILERERVPLAGVLINRTDPPEEWQAAQGRHGGAWARLSQKLGQWLGVMMALFAVMAFGSGLFGCRPSLPDAPVYANGSVEGKNGGANIGSEAAEKKGTGRSSEGGEEGKASGSVKVLRVVGNGSLGPGDVIAVKVYGEPKVSSGHLVIWPDGRISIPLVGKIVAAGATPGQLQRVITVKLKRYLKEPQVTVSVRKVVSRRVSVLGQVRKPGVYKVHPGSTLLSIIASAGGVAVEETEAGPQDTADLSRSVLLRRGKVVVRGFQKLMRSPTGKRNVSIQGGDIVYIPSGRHRRIHVLGEVNKPRRLMIKNSTTVMRAVAMARGFTKDADLDDIRLLRGGLGSKKAYRVDGELIAKGKKPDPQVKPGDIIYVPPTGMAVFNRNTNAIFRLVGAAMQATALGLAASR